MLFHRTVLALFFSAALIPSAVILPSTPASAQTSAHAGTISGTVRGDQGPLADATVTIVGPESRTVTSAADGTFAIAGLPDGTYSLSVKHAGFQPAQGAAVTVSGGSPQTVGVSLVAATLSSLRTIGRVSVNSRSSVVLNTTPAAEATITTQDYTNRGQTQVSNLLEELPGVELTRASSGGAPGANTNVAIRGADPYETQTLIDGHPITGGPSGTYLIQFLNPLLLSDIEVSKGPGSNGNTIANAVGGTVNFRTPQITAKESGLFSLGYDSFNGSTEAVRYSNTFGKLGFLVGYARAGTTGYNTQPILSVSADGPVGTGQVPNAVVDQSIPSTQLFDNKTELFKVGYNFSTSTNLTLGYFGSQSYVDYTSTLTTVEPVNIVGGACQTCADFNGFGKGPFPPLFNNPQFAGLAGQTVLASTQQDNLFLGNFETDNEPIFTADFRTAVGPATLLARYYTGSINRSISDPQEASQITACNDPQCSLANASFSGAFYQEQVDLLHGGDLEFDLPVGRDNVTLSYDTHSDLSTSCSGETPVESFRSCSVFNENQFSNTFSARGNIAVGNKANVTLANYFSNSTGVGSRYDPRLGLGYRPSSGVALRASAGTSYVAPFPDASEHFAEKTLTLASNLRPESSFSVDVGGDFLAGRNAKFSVDLYNTLIHDRFATANARVTGTFDGLPFTNENATYNQANSREAGVELTYVNAPRYGLGGLAQMDFLRSYAYGTNFLNNPLNFANTSQAGNYGNEADGAQTVGYPYFHGRFELNYRFHSMLRVAFGASPYGQVNSFNEPGFTLFDANMTLPTKTGFTMQLSVQNLFNHDDGRTLGEFAYGYAPPQDAGAVAAGASSAFNPTTLFFAPPRQVTFQLSHPL